MRAAKDLLPGNLNHTVCSYVPHPTARPLQLTLVTSCCTHTVCIRHWTIMTGKSAL